MRFSTMPDSEIISELCRRIKETRIQLGLSQIELVLNALRSARQPLNALN